jgi:preprotein translocase subunit SecE
MAQAEDIHDDLDAPAKTLGLERWVQFAFVALGGTTMFLADRLLNLAAAYLPPSARVALGGSGQVQTLATAIAAIVGIVTGVLLYRHPRVNPLAHEVASELSRVTWPSRQETYTSTVVVIVTSVIAATYLGLFDTVWSAVTDFLYSL